MRRTAQRGRGSKKATTHILSRMPFAASCTAEMGPMDPALTPTPLNMACGVHVMGWRMCAMVFQYTSGCWLGGNNFSCPLPCGIGAALCDATCRDAR